MRSARRRPRSPPGCWRRSARPSSARPRCSTSGCARRGRYPALVEELTEAAGTDPGYRRAGTLIVARDRDEAEALDRLHEFRRELDLPVERLLPSRARRLEPALAPALRLALHAPDDHAIDPRRLSAALADAARAAGAELRPHTPVAQLTVDHDRVTGVELAGGERLAASAVVIAAGPWSGGLSGVPDAAQVPVRPVKGQLLRLRDPAGPGLLERTVRFDGGYLVPRGDGRYVLGATMEDRGFDTAVTAGAVHDLLRDAAELVPGVLELEVEEALAGLRPGTPDNAPALGRSPAVDGLVWATGHHRNGVLLGPLSGELVADIVAGDEPPAWAAPFAPGRFAAAQVPA